MNQLEAFEMWTLRRILRIPWIDIVSNSKGPRTCRSVEGATEMCLEQKTGNLGYFLQGNEYKLSRLIMSGRIYGKRARGRKKLS